MEKLGAVSLSPDILQKSNIGLWALEYDEGKEPRMYCNEAMMQLLALEQITSPEATYHAWYDRVDSVHYGEIAVAIEKMSSGRHAEVQYPWHHPNGETWIIRCGGVRNYAYTNGLRIEGTHQNITSLAHIERKNTTQLLASLADNFLQIYFLNPYTGAFGSYAGNAFDGDEKRDYSKIDFYQDVAERRASIVHPDDIPLVDSKYSREHLIAVLESGESEEFIVRWPTGNNGGCVYMKNRLVPFADEDGINKIIIGVLNVTDEIQNRQALEDQLATVQGLSQDYDYVEKVIISEDKNLDYSVNFRSIGDISSYMPDWDESLSFHNKLDRLGNEIVYEPDREGFFARTRRNVILDYIGREKAYYVNFRIVFDGKVHHSRLKFAPIKDADGKIIEMIAAFVIVDDQINAELNRQKELENALALAESGNRAKTAFLFNMSHDIRTPMNAILGFTEMAQKHLDDPDRVNSCLEKVLSSGRHLLSLINNVLDMARIESGRMEIEEKVINIREASKAAMAIAYETAKERNVTLTLHSGPLGDVNIYGDELKLSQIALNIMSNAIKYTNPGGRVDVSVQEVPNNNPEKLVCDLIVEDNGIGMTKEFLERVFDPFERSATSTKSGVQGTGLGMSITKELVEKMGGRIWVESEPGLGTRVTVRFSFRRAGTGEKAAAQPESAAANTPDLRGKKILLVEDNELNREIALDILSEEGAIIDTAEDGDIAVEKVRAAAEGQYDLVLMDIQMPRMNGYEAAMAIRSLPDKRKASIPIIAMTANAFAEDKQNAFSAGMNGHVAKPLDVPKLLTTLAEILQ